VKKRINLVFVVAAFSDAWLGEGHISDLFWSKGASRRISQRLLDQLKKRIDLVLVVSAQSRWRALNATD
jgi:hypothetical protein